MKNRSIIESFNYAVTGIISAIKTERNMKLHYFIALVVIFLSLFFDFTRLEFLALLFSISLVFIAEMINTAIETVVDLVTGDIHPLAKLAKDISAGAVLIAAINSLIVGYLLFFDRINSLGNLVLARIKASPIHLSFIALILVTILTVGLKSIFYRGRGSHFQGGTVSGHAAISFCLATMIALISEDALIGSLAYFIGALVGESRIEGRIHSLFEVVAGSILGILVGILIYKIGG